MRYTNLKSELGMRNQGLRARIFEDGEQTLRPGSDRFEFGHQLRDLDARVLAKAIGRPADSSPQNALAGSDPRAGLNETAGFNDTIGSSQAINRADLIVTNNPNLFDTTLPSITVTGSVSTLGDTDFFSITLAAGELIVLDVDGTSGGLDSFLSIYGPNLQLIGDNDDQISFDPGSVPTIASHNTDSQIRFRAGTAGTYYFSIESFSDDQGPTSTGSYQLHVSIGPPGTAAQIAAEDVAAIQSGASWNHTNLTYGIPTSASQYPNQSWEELDDGNPAPGTTDFRAFNATQSAATAQLLQLISNVSNLTFTQNVATPGQADLRYAMSVDSEVDVAYAYYPTNGGPSSLGGTAWFNTTNFNSPARGNYAWMGILHESGHALGLKHGHEFPVALSADHDSTEFTVMTYRSFPGDDLGGYSNETWGYPQTLMMFDIAGLQAIYGANFNFNSGNSVYSWNSSTGEMSINGVGQGAPGGNRVFMTIWDGGGTDTYDLSNYGGGVSIDLTPGGWSGTSPVQLANLGSGHMARGNVFNALQYNGDPRSLIENALGGAGDDTIIGNSADNRLEGRGGNDQLFGNDGNDAFYFTSDFSALDRVDGGAGANDQIGLQGNYALANALALGANTITGVEVIAVLPGFDYSITTIDANVSAGGLLKVQATQLEAGHNLVFDGSAETNGSFILYGGQGNDQFTGGAGNDGFYFGPGGFNSLDIVSGGAGGNDQLALDGNYTIAMGGNVTGIEVLVLLPGPAGAPNTFAISLLEPFAAPGQTMTIFGLQVSTGFIVDATNEHDAALRFFGGSGADTISGGSLGDWIFGSDGGDTLYGGGGADTFYYDAVSQSASTTFDRLNGFDDSVDKIDLPFAVTGFASAQSGTLNASSFDATLATSFSGLNQQAAVFTATAGDMAGRSFLVIDSNGSAGYQQGADFVMELISPATPVDNPAIFV
jgi:serralysin